MQRLATETRPLPVRRHRLALTIKRDEEEVGAFKVDQNFLAGEMGEPVLSRPPDGGLVLGMRFRNTHHGITQWRAETIQNGRGEQEGLQPFRLNA